MDQRDFISLTGFGTVGSILLGLGLLGCLLHRDTSRLRASAVVGLTGGLLILDGAQLFHGHRPEVVVSLAVLASGTAVVVFLRSERDSVADPVKPPPAATELPENQNNAAKTSL
ncbi:MAG: hypothetical protein O3C17_05565 [Planctomycetota bacterium]|nr:hypothetical protein [Planctomycetota bacterium]